MTGPVDPTVNIYPGAPMVASCTIPKCGRVYGHGATEREALDALKALLADMGYHWPVEWDVLYDKETL